MIVIVKGAVTLVSRENVLGVVVVVLRNVRSHNKIKVF